MKTSVLPIVLGSLLLLAGCGSEKAALRDYLDEVMRSNDIMAGYVDEQRHWRRENEPLLATGEFPFEGAHEQMTRLIGAMESEASRLASVEAPPAAADLRRHTLDSYETSTEVFRRQFEIFDLLERITLARDQGQANSPLMKALVDRYEAIQQDLEVLVQQTSEEADRIRLERNRLAQTL